MGGAADTATPVTFVANALRRHLVLLVVMTLAGAAAGVAVAMRQGLHYTASASILLNPLQGNPFAPDGRGDQLVNLETEAQLVRTEGVTKLVKRELRLDVSDEALRERVDVENPTNTQVLRISYTASSREEALRGAQVFAESYLDYRSSRAQAIIDARLVRVRGQQSKLQEALSEATEELTDTDEGSARHALLEERIGALASQLASLEAEVSTLTTTDLMPGQVISPAEVPLSAGGTDAIVLGGAGGVGGLLVGALLALLRTRGDNRIHDPADVEAADLRLLGVVPDSERYTAAMAANPTQGLPECYRAIRTAVLTSLERPPTILSVAGASAEVSVAPEATAVATGLARAGFNVALVDAVGETTQMLAGRTLPGLAELLAGEADLRNVLVQPEDHLVLLPFGQPQRGTMDQLLSPRMLATIRRLRDWYDYVIIAGQSAAGADGQTLAALADGVVLVAVRGVTTHGELTACMSALARVQTVPVGAVVLDRPRSGRRGRTAPEAAEDTPRGSRPLRTATTSRRTSPTSARSSATASSMRSSSSTTPTTMTSNAMTHTAREAATSRTTPPTARSSSSSTSALSTSAHSTAAPSAPGHPVPGSLNSAPSSSASSGVASSGHAQGTARTGPAAAGSATTSTTTSSRQETSRREASSEGATPAETAGDEARDTARTNTDQRRSSAPDHDDDYPTALLYPADER